jgi:hypothetical protein
MKKFDFIGEKMEKQKVLANAKRIAEKTVAQQDFDKANKIRSRIEFNLKEIESLFTLVDESGISKFNIPGMKLAIINAIKAGLNKNGFNSKNAISNLKNYYLK